MNTEPNKTKKKRKEKSSSTRFTELKYRKSRPEKKKSSKHVRANEDKFKKGKSTCAPRRVDDYRQKRVKPLCSSSTSLASPQRKRSQGISSLYVYEKKKTKRGKKRVTNNDTDDVSSDLCYCFGFSFRVCMYVHVLRSLFFLLL